MNLGLKECPKCKYEAIFVPLVPAVGYDGRLYGGKSQGFCNSPFCDQLFWYYPSSGRVTKRNVGMTLKDYTDQNWNSVTDLRLINIRRRGAGMSPLMEMPDELWSTTPYKPPPLSLFAQFRGMFVGWYWYIVAALKSPFLGKLPSSRLLSGEKTINDVREEKGLATVKVDHEE